MTTPHPTASMSPEELIAVIERGLSADEEATHAAAKSLPADTLVHPHHWTAHRETFGGGPWDWSVSAGAVPLITACATCEHSGATEGLAVHIARHDPSRVLADVAAKREAVRLYRDTLDTIQMLTDHGHDGEAHRVAAESYLNILRALARPYLDQETP